MALIEKLTNIADAIREKTGGTEKLSLDGMAEAIAGISAGGGDEQSALDSLIDGSITEITSNVTRIRNYSFSYCENCTTADFPLLTELGNYTFQYCTNLTSINAPIATNMGSYTFYECPSLTSVNLPLVKGIGNSAFQRCRKLTSVNFPKATTVGNNAFYSCSYLTSVDFPLATSLGVQVFSNCYNLKAVVLRSDSICSLSNTNAFTNCYHFHGTVNATYNPDGLKDGYIYVPAALVESYKTATNWSEFATQFRALEDYTVDGTTTGVLDESKI